MKRIGRKQKGLQSCDSGNEAKNDARSIGYDNRPITVLLKKTIGNPGYAVDAGHHGLEPISFVPAEIVLYVLEIKDIHENCGDCADDTHHALEFSFIHTMILIMWEFVLPLGRYISVVSTLRAKIV